MNLHFILIPHGSGAYKEAVALREAILRKPLGKRFSPEELAAEKEHWHIGGYVKEELVASAMLVLQGERCKMQRVAVRADRQGQGIGSAMLAFCEQLAHERGIPEIYCHARETAIPFYLRHGYVPKGDAFEEQGIPHLKMHKMLDI